LALLGRHSLAVFSLHLPLAIAATTTIEMLAPSRATQVALGILVVALLFGWAAVLENRTRRRQAPIVNVAVAPAAVGLPGPLAGGQVPAMDLSAVAVVN
jgi:uncharacterized membrane protein